MEINLDDYDIIIESVNNFEDNDIERWISSSKKPKRIEKKLKKLSETGGNFTANGYDVTSTDLVDIPFMVKQGEKWAIQFGKARMVHFFPSLTIDLDETADIDRSQMSLDISREMNKSSDDINLSLNNVEMNNSPKDIKRSKKRKYEEPELVIKEEPTLNATLGPTDDAVSPKKKKRKSNNDTEPIKSIIHETNNINNHSEHNGNKVVSSLKYSEEPSIIQKKKKKSKVTFAEDEPMNKKEAVESLVVDLNTSSRLNASENFETAEEDKSLKKKKRKHSHVEEIEKVNDVVKAEKKSKKNKKAKIEAI